MALGSVFALIMHESPIWLLNKGETGKARTNLRQVCKINNILDDQCEEMIDALEIDDDAQANENASINSDEDEAD